MSDMMQTNARIASLQGRKIQALFVGRGGISQRHYLHKFVSTFTIPSTPHLKTYSSDVIISAQFRLDSVQKFIGANRLPHLLFYGPPGTGKTSTILAIARQLYQTPMSFRNNVLEVRARITSDVWWVSIAANWLDWNHLVWGFVAERKWRSRNRRCPGADQKLCECPNGL